MKTTRQLNVFYGDRKVGTLALHQNRIAAFANERVGTGRRFCHVWHGKFGTAAE